MTDCLGIDLNGLVDGVFKFPSDGGLGKGAIPSVVVLPVARGRGPLTVVGGAEAIQAIEGQGWEWPESARNRPDGLSLRIPMCEIIRGVLDGGTLRTPLGEVEAADLMAAGLTSLRDQAGGGAAESVVVLRDNGQYDELVQQRLLDALARRRASATLLWRPVACLLGILKDLGPSVSRLYGKRVGVVSIMADGIDVSSMATERDTDDNGDYLVPVRDRAGIHVPFEATLFDCAREVARRIMPGDPAQGWQVLWGNGLALQRLVGMLPSPRLLQRGGTWVLHDAADGCNVNLPALDPAALGAARDMLRGVSLLVLEGPASEARGGDGKWLTYQVDETLDLGIPVGYRGRRDSFVAARGAAEYAHRRSIGRHAYFDFLPQIRIVASVENVPTFVPVIPKDARVEGGTTFKPPPLDLGLVVKPNNRLDIYLTREGDSHPRKAIIDIPSPPPEAVRVRLGIEQRPVQGLARLTLIPEDPGSLPVIELDWHRMVPDERTEEQIIEDLSVDPTKVPPLAPVDAHWAMWNNDIEALLGSLQTQLGQGHTLRSCERKLDQLAKLLSRRSPIRTGEERDDGPPVAYRMISTDGRFPDRGDARADLVERYTLLLRKLDEAPVDQVLSSQSALRSAIVRIGSWSFTSCPDTVRRHLVTLAKGKRVVSPQLDFGAMGRVFTAPEEIAAFCGFMASMSSLNRNHLEALLSVFSLRANAGRCIDTRTAERITVLTLDKLEPIKSTTHRKIRMPRACIKLLAGLLRHRMRNPKFLQPGSGGLAGRLVAELERKQSLPGADPFTLKLAKSALDYVFEQGSDSNILGQDADFQDEDGQADDED